MRNYLDKTVLMNPLSEYFNWIKCKIYYQTKNWGKHLRINYKCIVSNSRFGRYNWLGSYTRISNCTMGDFTYCGDNCLISNLTIGKFCSIGPGVKIAPGKHPSTGFVSTHPATFNNQRNFVKNFVSKDNYKSFGQVTIGNDVWIGADCIIIDGVTIADGAIIAANSVVSKDIGAYCIAGGVPAKIIKKRFTDEEITVLLGTKWWDKGDHWVQNNIEKFWSISEFIASQKSEPVNAAV
jgi:acetyltransferase-like isoleucine patch superfamily enzyme